MTVRGSAYGNMLIAARRAAGLSQMEVAKRVGVAQSTYSKWEAGESDMQAIHVRPLAKVLQLTLDDIVPVPSVIHEYEEPSERLGLLLIKRVVAAIETGRLGPRQARVLLDLLDEIAPERKPE